MNQMKTLISQGIFNSNTCRILFATCLSALCLAALSTEAATITVMNTNDSGAGSPSSNAFQMDASTAFAHI